MLYVRYQTPINENNIKISEEINKCLTSINKLKKFLDAYKIGYTQFYMPFQDEDQAVDEITKHFINSASQFAGFNYWKYSLKLTSIVLINNNDTEKMYESFEKFLSLKSFW